MNSGVACGMAFEGLSAARLPAALKESSNSSAIETDNILNFILKISLVKLWPTAQAAYSVLFRLRAIFVLLRDPRRLLRQVILTQHDLPPFIFSEVQVPCRHRGIPGGGLGGHPDPAGRYPPEGVSLDNRLDSAVVGEVNGAELEPVCHRA